MSCITERVDRTSTLSLINSNTYTAFVLMVITTWINKLGLNRNIRPYDLRILQITLQQEVLRHFGNMSGFAQGTNILLTPALFTCQSCTLYFT